MSDEASITALLIDDHAVVLQGYRSLLEHSGIAVVGAVASVEEGLPIYRALKPRVVVTDLAMPGTHGLQGIQQMLEEDASARILVFSMHDDVVMAARALDAGAAGFVTKTRSSDELLRAVERIAIGERFLSADIAIKLAVRQAKDDATGLHALNAREFECFRLLSEGQDVASVAARLELSPGSVTNMRNRLMRKLGVATIADLARLAVARGIVRKNV